jgi:S1-C subfamily serine protease
MPDNESDNGDGWQRPDSYIGPWAARDDDDPGHGSSPHHGWNVSAAPPASPGPPGPPRRRRRRGHLGVYLGVAVLAAGVGAGLTVAFDGQGASPAAGMSSRDVPSSRGSQAGGSQASGGSSGLNEAAVEQRVKPGLVDITSTLKYESETAEGTGMILSSSGLVLTNNHVIDGATKVVATLVDDGQVYPARVVGYDAKQDVAVLKLIGAAGLATVSFGDSSQVQVGAAVLALGDAEGRGGVTPAPGDISALDRSIQASDEGSGTTEDLNHMLETDAEIQQGDSGGALADSAGQVIGMITAANTASPGQPGGTMGFAIPINTALLIARQIAGGQSTSSVYIGVPGFLGVEVSQSNSPNPRQQAEDERRAGGAQGGAKRVAKGGGQACVAGGEDPGVPSRIAPAHAGALILGVLCGTAAQARGLAPGDVITSVDGRAVTTPGSLTALTAQYRAGAVVHVGWEGPGGARHTTPIRLGTGPAR